MALGHGPEWHLEIIEYRRTIIFTSRSVTATYEYAAYGPTVNTTGNTTTYMGVGTDHRIGVVMREKFCQDSETGKAYGITVAVWLDGKQYSGCGNAVHNTADK